MQVINLGANCFAGQAIHEIGHALGLFHEQTRSDRGDFVNFFEDNVDGNDNGPDDPLSHTHEVAQFEPDFNDIENDFAGYDYCSIMHP